MDILTSDELKLIGIFYDRSTRLVFKGKEFVLGPSFSLNKKSVGISFCIQEEENGHQCLLVETSNSIAVWKSVKTRKKKSLDHHLSKIEKEELISSCLLELTKCIGPIATLIIEDLEDEANNMSPIQFVNIIAEQIPDLKVALAFRQKMSQ